MIITRGFGPRGVGPSEKLIIQDDITVEIDADDIEIDVEVE